MVTYYAHSREGMDPKDWHPLRQHLLETGELAASFASSFGAYEFGMIVGLLHDIGKFSIEFQQKLRGRDIKVDHSTAGAKEAIQRYGRYRPFGCLMAYAIAGHHAGIPDWGSVLDESSLAHRLQRDVPEYKAFALEVELPEDEVLHLPSGLRPDGFSIQLFIRMLYSCLVDADYLDTERFVHNGGNERFGRRYALPALLEVLDGHIDRLMSNVPPSPINRLRRDILLQCREKASSPPGFFTLTVPTGGGKTLSSMSFALRHAVRHGKERVIYVIPYTSIIEQNADVFRRILGEANVLEHHSNFDYASLSNESGADEGGVSTERKLRLAAENWDIPVIVTTNVQFFESLFAARSSKCRKLHNIANSVVIVDEAQMLPSDYLIPCLNTLVELAECYRTTVVLSTATQPAIAQLLPRDLPMVEMARDPEWLYEAFRRVRVFDLGTKKDDEIIQLLLSHRQVLCVVNSKMHARLLFKGIREYGAFHLSTRMCPAHRSETLRRVKAQLAKGEPCRLVSTQLIEAGVDVDFPVVFRSMAGLDSLAQTAGRCNREGKLEEGSMFVFWPAERHGMPRGWLSRTASVGQMMLKKHRSDVLSPAAIEEYFLAMYDIDRGELDKKNIVKSFREQAERLRFPFRSIAEIFKLIDDHGTSSIIVPWDTNCTSILNKARRDGAATNHGRLLQRYVVQVFEDEMKELQERAMLELVAERYWVLREEVFRKYYSNEVGLEPLTKTMVDYDCLIV